MQLLFIPFLVGMIMGLNALLAWLEIELPTLVRTVVFFLAFGGLYVGCGYLVAAWVERKLARDEAE